MRNHIALRHDLFTHPRLLSLVTELTRGSSRGAFWRHVFGPDCVTERDGTVTVRDGSVTLNPTRLVTQTALRDIVVALILRVWCALHGDGDGSVMATGVELSDIDTVAGVEGFGAALHRVGWVRTQSSDQVEFDTLTNAIQGTENGQTGEKRAMTPAERSRAYRARKRALKTTVTKPSRNVTISSRKSDAHHDFEAARHETVTKRHETVTAEVDIARPRVGAIGISSSCFTSSKSLNFLDPPPLKAPPPLPEPAPLAELPRAAPASSSLFENANESATRTEKPPPKGGVKKQAKRPGVTPEFAEFWNAYPVGHKIDKQKAMLAWQKINPDSEEVRKIMHGLELWKRHEKWTHDGGKFIPHPTTWLNNRRWEAELLTVEPSTANATQAPKKGSFEHNLAQVEAARAKIQAREEQKRMYRESQ